MNNIDLFLETELNPLFTKLRVAFWRLDMTDLKFSCSSNYGNLVGFNDSSELTFDNRNIFVEPDSRARLNNKTQECIDGKIDAYDEAFLVTSDSKTQTWLIESCVAVEKDNSGKARILLGLIYDISFSNERADSLLDKSLYKKEQHVLNLQTEVEQTIEILEQSKKLNDAILSSNPHSCLLFNDKFQLIYCNEASVKMFNAKSKEDFVDNFETYIKHLIPEYQHTENGKVKSVPLKVRLANTIRDGHTEFETVLNIGGKTTPFSLVFKNIPHLDTYVNVVHAVDLTDLVEARNNLIQNDLLVNTINNVTSTLISAEPNEFNKVIFDAMGEIGKIVDVDRVYIWENFEENGELYCAQTYEWSEGAEPQQGKDFTIQMPYSCLPYWKKCIVDQNIPVNSLVKDLPQEERDELNPQGILSIVVVPILVKGKSWGFMGFDDCHNYRIFDDAGLKALSSGANTLVSAILRNETTKNLVIAKEEALASTKAKSEFLARMSHEIRTPMNAILGMNKIAQQSDDIDVVRDYLKKVESSSNQLLGIINDILDMSKIEANKLDINHIEFDFHKMIKDIDNVIKVRANEKGQTFQIDFEKPFEKNIISDELRLSQVLINLLNNAVKFTPEGGSIITKIEDNPIDETKSLLRVSIADTGIGIAKDKQETLFNSFEQADGSITREFGGTGLGLAISKNIIELMGGNLWFESEEGQGTTFIFEIEFAWGVGNQDITLDAEPETDESLLDLTSKNILIVEDIDINREIIITLLDTTNANIEIACNGQEAVDKFQENSDKYDLILMDLQMPELDGLAATVKIRSFNLPNAKDVPIIAMTANAFKEDIIQCQKAGMNDHVAKPIEIKDLFKKIRKHV